MKGGAFLLLLALVIAVMVISGRYKCGIEFLKCFSSGSGCNCNSQQNASQSPTLPKLEPLPQIKIF